MTDLQERLAKFANETGRTVPEWLAAWRSGLLDKKSTGAKGRYAQALALETEIGGAK